MPARTDPRPIPGPVASGAAAQLPWWAVALPALAFLVLLFLLLGGPGSDAADPMQPTVQLIALLERSLAP